MGVTVATGRRQCRWAELPQRHDMNVRTKQRKSRVHFGPSLIVHIFLCCIASLDEATK